MPPDVVEGLSLLLSELPCGTAAARRGVAPD